MLLAVELEMCCLFGVISAEAIWEMIIICLIASRAFFCFQFHKVERARMSTFLNCTCLVFDDVRLCGIQSKDEKSLIIESGWSD